ncbi:hypothetical protein UPYG_G00130810 [Umbra pygmaea]|uniref:Microtubule-associated protein 10 C-terminal domain-containing protein n=1 Tax=Umbra pygmaea TaxID=75934 RepID=A0ABD0XDY6_UMBPY
MTEQLNNKETLFAFEILVEYIKMHTTRHVQCYAGEFAVGVRLLDFPTLLIYQPEPDADHSEKENQVTQPTKDTYVFNKGKSCLFKTHLESLHVHLTNTPLYAMVLDVKSEIPRLVGSSLVSLASLMDRVRYDVGVHGIATPSTQAKKGLVDILNLMGEKIGCISLGYKLISLGADLLPHFPENRVLTVGIKHGSGSIKATEHSSTNIGKGKSQPPYINIDNTSSNIIHKNIQMNSQPTETVVPGVKQTVSPAPPSGNSRRPKHHRPVVLDKAVKWHDQERLTEFCPPPLFYNSSVGRQQEREPSQSRVLHQDVDSDQQPAAEEDEPSAAQRSQRTNVVVEPMGRGETGDCHPQHRASILVEALRELPLLNALLVELSQLNAQTQNQLQQPVPVHSNLAWLHSPLGSLPDASEGKQMDGPQGQEDGTSPQRQRMSPGTRVKDRPPAATSLNPPPHSNKKNVMRGNSLIQPHPHPNKKNVMRGNSLIQPHPHKLSFATTKTFRLRMMRVNPAGMTRHIHECRGPHTDTWQHPAKGKQSNNRKTAQRPTSSRLIYRSSILNENIETLVGCLDRDRRSAAQQDRSSQRMLQGVAGTYRTSVNPEDIYSKREETLHKTPRHKPSSTSKQENHSPLDSNESLKRNKDESLKSEKNQSFRRVSDKSLKGGRDESIIIDSRLRHNLHQSGSSTKQLSHSGSSSGSSRNSGVVEYLDDFTSLDLTYTEGYSPEPARSGAKGRSLRSPDLSSPEPARGGASGRSLRSPDLSSPEPARDGASGRSLRSPDLSSSEPARGGASGRSLRSPDLSSPEPARDGASGRSLRSPDLSSPEPARGGPRGRSLRSPDLSSPEPARGGPRGRSLRSPDLGSPEPARGGPRGRSLRSPDLGSPEPARGGPRGRSLRSPDLGSPEPARGGPRGRSLRSPDLSSPEPARGGPRGRSGDSVGGGVMRRRRHIDNDVSGTNMKKDSHILVSSSPESVGGGASDGRRSHVSGDHSSDGSIASDIRSRIRLAPPFPVPVKAETSPQRSLANTQVIRPRTQASALTVSSDSAESLSAPFRNQQAAGSRSGGAMKLDPGARATSANRSPGSWSEAAQDISVSESQPASSKLPNPHTESTRGSVRAPFKQLTVSTDADFFSDFIPTRYTLSKNHRPGKQYFDPYTPALYPSSEAHDPKEAEEVGGAEEFEEADDELEDTLGSLGISKKCQHISELLANKLPGYTL